MDGTLPPELSKVLTASESRNERVVVMTCGISGSGKSTLSRKILSQYKNFIRLSIDQYIFTHHGLYGKDYGPSVSEAYHEEAHDALKIEFSSILAEGKRDVVLDFSFYNREFRDEWREVVREKGKGATIILVCFEASEDVLWRRVQERNRGVRNADSAAKISRELLGVYAGGFEKPLGEEEGAVIVIKVE